MLHRRIDCPLANCPMRPRAGYTAPVPVLTDRQCQVLYLVCQGRSSKQIARLLDVTLRTVEHHRADAMHRAGVHDIPALMRLAFGWGWVDAPTPIV